MPGPSSLGGRRSYHRRRRPERLVRLRFWHGQLIDTTDEAVEWIEATRQKWTEESSANWAIIDRASGQILGRTALTRVALHEGAGEVAYWVLPEARGRGVARRASAAVVEWAFTTLGLHRLVLDHSVHNVASCHVAERLGFAAEGTLRSARKHPDGWHDMHLHARIASDPRV